MTTEIDCIIEQIENEIRVDIHGKGTMSVRGVARLISVEHSSLIRAFEGGAQKPSKLAVFLLGQGFECGAQLDFWDALVEIQIKPP
ncbi:MAG: hypothetical protein AAGA75_17920 [Cyanobacteria bacterium P01_E01_bin.6]